MIEYAPINEGIGILIVNQGEKMKKRIKLITLLLALGVIFTPNVDAKSATMGISSDNEVKVGDTFTVDMYLSDIEDTNGGIVAGEANLVFDNEYFEYVGSTSTDRYTFYINPDYNYKVAGLDFTLANGITSKETIMSFEFTALKEGTSEITLKNTQASDLDDLFYPEVIGNTITIEDSNIVETNIENTNTKPVEKAVNYEQKPVEKDAIKETQTVVEELPNKNDDISSKTNSLETVAIGTTGSVALAIIKKILKLITEGLK